MRRTVNDAPAPSPRLRITTPSKACSRSFSPSMTFTETRTVSPGSNAPRSFFSSPASTIRMASITVSSLVKIGRLLAALSQAVHPLLLFRGQVRRLQQVRPPLPRAPHRHEPAPARDAAVIARQQHLGRAEAAEHLGTRVLRMLEQPARERVPVGRLLLAEHPGQ